MSIIDKANGLNHWSVGIALLGIILSLAPAATEIGVGISAIGVAYYAASKGRLPAWCILSALPILGALSSLIILTMLSPHHHLRSRKPFMKIVLSPLLWLVLLLLLSILAWWAFNPSAAAYKTKTYRQKAAAVSLFGCTMSVSQLL
jgi:hypothetical protein